MYHIVFVMSKTLRDRLTAVVKNHIPLTVIIGAALMLEVTVGVMYYSAQSINQQTMQNLVEEEMNTIFLSIRDKLTKVETVLDNMAWVVTQDLDNPDKLAGTTRLAVEHNADILGCAVSCIPNYYPEKGYWYEPYSVRRADGSIESMQLGSALHDYTKSEFYTAAIEKDSGHWSAPYMDKEGAKAIVTTYSVPVHDKDGKTVAVVDADISLNWLDDVLNEEKSYQSTQCFLVTGKYFRLAGEDTSLYLTALDEVKADSDKHGYVTLKDENGELHHVFFHPIGGTTDWILISVCDDNEIFGPLRHVRHILGLLAVATLLFIGFIVYRTSKNLERLRKVNAEKERIGAELQVANKIQQSMLPKQQLAHEHVEIYASLVPAREVGGDLYDYYVRDEKLFFCIGDVSGKGAAAAMLMGVTHSLFRAFSSNESNPSRIMEHIDAATCQGNDTNMFVTLFIGVLDLPTGLLRYCNAGHEIPMTMYDKECQPLTVDANLPLGVFADIKYTMQETNLQAGSTLFLYTDGLTEAMNAQHKQFGTERTISTLKTCAQEHLMPAQTVEAITSEVHRHVGDAEQSDDLTLLAIYYKPSRFESTHVDAIVLKNNLKEIEKLSIFIKSILTKQHIDTSQGKQLRLAIEEAVVNVIDYAYPASTEGSIEVRMMTDGKCLKTIIIDSGVRFDPTAKEKADTTLSAEDRQIGGLGILLVRELMDSINYERINNQNVLTLIKKYN